MKNPLNKVDYNFLLFLLLATILVVLVVIYINGEYMFLVGNDLLDESQLIFDGDIKLDNNPDVKINSNNLIGPFRNKEVDVENIEDIDYVYNVFKFSGFVPYENYNVKLKFRAKGLDVDTNFLIGTQQIKAENHVNDDTSALINNVNLENYANINKGYSDDVAVDLDFQANEDGDIYVYVGIKTNGVEELHYSLSQVRLQIQ